MQRLTISTHLRGEAAEPAGEPPTTDPRAASVSIAAVAADGSVAAIERLSYENHVTFSGPSTFTETGTLSIDGDVGGELDIVTVGEGKINPAADTELLHGAVVYAIVEGRGRLAGATGLITSNFVLTPAKGEFEERQVAVVFVP